MKLLVFTILGAGLGVASILAIRSVWRNRRAYRSARWSLVFVILILLGVALGVSSFKHPLAFSYKDGEGTVVGFPFLVAYFDAEGRDFVGPLTIVGAYANAVFWFLIPWLLVPSGVWTWRKVRPDA